MKDSQIHFHWQERKVKEHFRGAVSLHSHTLHSRECLDFIGRATANTPWLSRAIRKQKEKYRALKGRDVDLSRAWWTPPLSALNAWKLEKTQIEGTHDRRALVSLTDHDNIEAGLHLSMLHATPGCPISVEWTVPWRQTFFHLGVHNVPAQEATTLMRDLQAITADPRDESIAAMLDHLHSFPSTLIVMNHPSWDENHIGAALHGKCVESFLAHFMPFIHALELNGLRPWKENLEVMKLATGISLPVISGGDRHAREPNACVNLTNAGDFAEFVDEVRSDGWSDVLFMPQYREPFKLRIVQNMCDILEDDPGHSLGWIKWSDRVFYLTDEGTVKSLGQLWGKKFPSVVNQFVALMSITRQTQICSALRLALNQGQEFAL